MLSYIPIAVIKQVLPLTMGRPAEIKTLLSSELGLLKLEMK